MEKNRYRKTCGWKKMKKALLISAYPNKENSLTEQIIYSAFDDLDMLHLVDYDLPFYKGEDKLHPKVEKVFKRMGVYDFFIFAFPVYWSNMPAILKNLLDWSIFWGVKYDFNRPPEPALKDKSAFVVCSSGDQYSDKDKKEIIGLVSSRVLELWGVTVEKEIFIDYTYKFNKNRFNKIIENLKSKKH